MVSNRQPRSYWGIIFAVGFLTCLPALSQEPREPPDEAQVEATPDDSERKPAADENPGPELNPASDLLAPVQGIESAIRDLVAEQRRAAGEPPNEHEVSDLKAQKAMALWAMLMFVASVASVAVTAAGLELLRRTLNATKDAATYAESAARAAWETVEQAKAATLAAQEAVGVTREVGQAQVRAYISVSAELPKGLALNQTLRVKLSIKNTGQSPAHSVVCRALLVVRDCDFDGNEDFTILKTIADTLPPLGENLGVIPSGSFTEGIARCGIVSDRDFPKRQIDDGYACFTIVAIVTYRDVFNNILRQTRYCAILEDAHQQSDPKTPNDWEFRWQPTRFHNDAT